MQWYASVFRTNNSNDIILLATDINGFGYFANAGTTRRQGIETGFTFTAGTMGRQLQLYLVGCHVP